MCEELAEATRLLQEAAAAARAQAKLWPAAALPDGPARDAAMAELRAASERSLSIIDALNFAGFRMAGAAARGVKVPGPDAARYLRAYADFQRAGAEIAEAKKRATEPGRPAPAVDATGPAARAAARATLTTVLYVGLGPADNPVAPGDAP